MTLVGHTSYVNTVMIENNNLLLISASKDRKVKVWNLQTGELVRELVGHSVQLSIRSLLLCTHHSSLFSSLPSRNLCTASNC